MGASVRKPNVAQRRRVIAASAMASAMAFIDMTAVNTALPAMQRSLGATTADAQWIMEAYLLFLAALLMVGGALGDRFGRRRVFRWGVLAFAVTSLACGLATSPVQLILARAGQGMAAALLAPSSLALLNASFPPEDRAEAVGIWAATTSLMVPLGPVLGGALTDSLGWSWIFYINLPVALAVLVALRGVERPPYDPPEGGRFDIAGAATATLGLGGLVFAMIELPRLGTASPWVWGSLTLGVIGLAGFLFVERRVAAPMFPLGLLRRPTFAGINLQSLLLFGAIHAVTFYLPFLLVQARGFSALAAGAALFPMTVAISVLSRFSGRLVARFGRRRLVVTGPAVAGTGIVLIALAAPGAGFWTGLMPGIVVMALGIGLTVAPLTAIAINAAGEGRSGIASGVNNAVARTGGLLAIALLGLVAVPTFEADLARQLGPDRIDIDPDVRRAVLDQGLRMGGIVLPTELAPEMAEGVRARIAAAHATAFRLTMLLAAASMGLAALVAWRSVDRPGAMPPD